MTMKSKLYIIIFISLFCVSCGSLNSFFKSNTSSQDKLDKKVVEIDSKKNDLSKNSDTKLKQIGTLSYGIGHALDKEKSPTENVSVAKELNDRVSSLAGSPDIKDANRIKNVVNQLVSEIEKEKAAGINELKRLDNELQYSQSERVRLQSELNRKIDEFKKISIYIAEKNDENTQIVDSMDKWFGLGAVFYGLKKFVISSALILTIGSILFLVLRILAQSNPIAATVFSLFEMAGSTILHLFKAALPNSFQFAKFVDKDTSEKYRITLDKIVDTLQILKERGKGEGVPADKKVILDEIFNELSVKLDDSEKRVVNERLQSMNWKI